MSLNNGIRIWNFCDKAFNATVGAVVTTVANPFIYSLISMVAFVAFIIT